MLPTELNYHWTCRRISIEFKLVKIVKANGKNSHWYSTLSKNKCITDSATKTTVMQQCYAELYSMSHWMNFI